MKPQILVLSFTYPPSKDGVANAAALMAEGLASRGHEVSVGTLWLPERGPCPAGSNPRVSQFRIEGLFWREKAHGEIREASEFISRFGGDVVFCHTLESALTRISLKALAGVPAAKVLVSHGSSAQIIPWHGQFPWGLGAWLRWQPFVWQLPSLLKKFDRLVFLSRQQDFGRFFDHRVARLIGHPGIRTIPNGVVWRATPDAPPRFRLAHGLEGKVMFLCVANYGDRKNQLLALEAYRRARIPNSVLVFIGSEFNDYSRQVQRADAQLAVDYPEGRVLLLERQERAVTEAAFCEADALVLSAKQETQPIVLLEAMAAAKPFVSTDTGCVRELAGGIVVGSEKEMTRELRRLASEPELRAGLGKEGHGEYLAKYRKEAVLDAYEKLVAELRSEKRTRLP